MTVVQDIYEWSLTRPLWQRDGLRRLLHQGSLARQDVEELAQICRSEVGLSPPSTATVTAVALSESDFGDAQSKSPGVRISSVRDTQCVNALAPGKVLRLHANGVTVVYGDNGAGKSGYVRVLKKLCRARGGAHSIHPNIFQQAAGTPSATIDFALGDEERTHLWIDGQPGPA